MGGHQHQPNRFKASGCFALTLHCIIVLRVTVWYELKGTCLVPRGLRTTKRYRSRAVTGDCEGPELWRCTIDEYTNAIYRSILDCGEPDTELHLGLAYLAEGLLQQLAASPDLTESVQYGLRRGFAC